MNGCRLFMQHPLAYIRSFIFLIVLWITIVIFGLSCLISGLFSYRLGHWFNRTWVVVALFLVRIICGLRYRVHGRENLPDTPSVVLMNHQAQWETMALLVIIPAHTWVLKRELFKLPFFGWALRVLKPIAIDRSAGKEAFAQMLEQGKERLKEGLWIVVYPEGTRVPIGQTRKYKTGGARLAKEAGVNVVPMAHNAGHYWRLKSMLRLPGTIDVHIGPPINTADKSVKEINAEVRAWIEQTIKKGAV